MKRKLIAILAAAAMMMSLFTLPVMAENTDKPKAESSISTDVSEETDDTAEEEIKGGLMALTFDDGPSKATITLLDELKKRDIQATFFVVGKRLDEFSDVLVREYKEGHEIGSHTWDHLNLTQADSTTANQNLQNTEDKVYEILGTDIGPLIIRPPYGSVNDTVRGYVDVPLILWSIDTLDWKYRDADAVKQRIINQAEDGAIILLHDLYDTSVAGVIAAIDELQKEGYTFVTVSELFRRKGEVLETGVTYTNAEANGVDLGPLPEPDPEAEEKAKKDAEREARKAEREKKWSGADRVDKGFPTAWLIFCGAILLIYGAGMLHCFNIVHIAPFDKILKTEQNRKDSLNEKTALTGRDRAADGNGRRRSSQRRGNHSRRNGK